MCWAEEGQRQFARALGGVGGTSEPGSRAAADLDGAVKEETRVGRVDVVTDGR